MYDLLFKASFSDFMDTMPEWTPDQIAGLAFGVRFPFPYAPITERLSLVSARGDLFLCQCGGQVCCPNSASGAWIVRRVWRIVRCSLLF